jgi:hypothetical protein
MKMGVLRRAAAGGAGLAVAALTISGVAMSAPAYAAGSGSMGVYQVGLSINCDTPSAQASGSPACASDGTLGGFWGWWAFDSPGNDPTQGYGGDGQATGCSHGGGFNGAGHSVFDITDWYIQVDPTMGIPTFYASWTETDTFRGQSQTYQVTDQTTGIPAMTIHRQVLQLFGIPTPPGASLNVQVSWKPAH